MDKINSIHGYCPKCNMAVWKRERRLNGNDQCMNGHIYPSKESMNEPCEKPRVFRARRILREPATFSDWEWFIEIEDKIYSLPPSDESILRENLKL